MITEDFVSFETAKLLKEKDFKEKCNATYNLETGEFKTEKTYQVWTTKFGKYISAPTLQMAMKWLRKEHNIYIDDLLLELKDGDYGYVIEDTITRDYLATSGNDSYQSPEEAAEAAIKYCLENLV